MPTGRQCAYCDRQFTRTEHLLRHVRTHTKEKPFKCPECSRTYTREDTLIRHAKSHRSSVVGQEPGLRRPSQDPAQPLSPHGSHNGGTQIASPSLHSDQTPGPNAMFDFLRDQNGYMSSLDDLTALVQAGTPHMHMPIDSPERGWDVWSMPFTQEFQTSMSNGAFAMDTNGTVPEELLDPNMGKPQPEASADRQPAELRSPSEFNIPNVERIWFTKMRSDGDGSTISTAFAQATSPITPYSEFGDVDEQYRLQLSKAVLPPQPRDDPLPSSDFLNLCMRLYFTRFSPLFPIVHSATFRPTAENGLLLLSMTSIGCLFLGSPAAVRRGRQIFKKLNKAILASWEKVLVQSNDEPLAMLQASVLGQTFALLSGEPQDIALCEAFHGSTITLARRGNVFGRKAAIVEVQDLTPSKLEATWRLWARREEMNRVCAALRIQDAELCALLHLEPLLRHGVPETPSLASSPMFSAPTAAEWSSLVQSEGAASQTGMIRRVEGNASLSAYVVLEGLGTSIADDRRHDRLDEAAVNSYHGALTRWYESYGESSIKEEPDRLCLAMLWHWVNMCVLVDFDQLERAIGRDGPIAAEPAIQYFKNWVSSRNAPRCLLHAFFAQGRMQCLPSNSTPALHVARILFSTAILWYCILQYGSAECFAGEFFEDATSQFTAFESLRAAAQRYVFEITQLSCKRTKVSDMKARTLCELGDSLQQITHWGIAGKFAKIVACLIYRDPQDTSNDR